MEIKRYELKSSQAGNYMREHPEGEYVEYEAVQPYLEPQPIENAPTNRQIIAYCLREDGTWAFVGAGWVVNGKFPVRTWEDIATHYLEFPLPPEVKR